MAASPVAEAAREPAPSAPLALSVKLAYGAPAFAGAAMAIPIAVLMPRFYSDVVLAPLGMIALMIAVARSFDALTDPAMGWLSDRTRTRFGRRKPWIALGTPFAAVAFWLLFAPPAGLDGADSVLWFGCTFAAFHLFQSMEGVPMAALGAELSGDYHERSSLFGIRTLFIAGGILVASVAPSLIRLLPGIADERAAFAAMSAAYAVVWIALVVVMLPLVRERAATTLPPPEAFVPGVRRALRNHPFRVLLLAGVVGAIPSAVPAILIPYLVRYVLQAEDANALVGLYLALYFLTGLLCLPFWLRLSQRIGKLRAFVGASAIGVAASVLYFFTGAGDFWLTGCIVFVSGTQSMTGTFLVPAMAADVIDYDELHTGRRREAQYSAFWSVIPKLVAIPGSSVPLSILAAVGYVPNQVQSDEVQLTIRLLYSLFPAAFYVASLLIVLRYPISEEVHRRIRDGLAAHARGETARDPLTGRRVPPPRPGDESEEEAWFLDSFSTRELRAVLERGPQAALRSVLVRAGLAAGVAAGAAALVVAGFGSLAENPHPATVFAVVAAGLALTALAFHALRISPALRLRRSPPSPEAIRAHLEAVSAEAR